jgi:hypothetical protein
MARTLFDGPTNIATSTLTRALLNTTLSGSAVIAKVIAGTNVSITSTGADAGTGDVTINVSVSGYAPTASPSFTGTVNSAGAIQTASLFSPTVYGGTSFSSTLTLQSTNSGLPISDAVYIKANGATSISFNSSGIICGDNLNLVAGSATQAPLYFTAGTNLTTAGAGAVEFDGVAFYSSVVASARGVIPSAQIQILTAAYVASFGSSSQLLNGTSTGAVTLHVGTYEFECAFSLTGMSSTSGTFGFYLGGTFAGTQAWQANASKVTTLSAAAPSYSSFNTAINTALMPASTLTSGLAFIKGIIRVTTPGTVIPTVTVSTSASVTIGANSYFKISPLGSSSVAYVGQWS